MKYYIAYFKPEHFYPVPEGTILRYRGHQQNYDTKQYEVYMDVIGGPPPDWDKEKNSIIHEIDTNNISIPLIHD